MTNDEVIDFLENAITTAFGGFVTKWTVLAEVVDSDGDRSMAIAHTDQMAIWDQLGLLRWADALITSEALDD